MDGREVLEAIKSDPELASIPVVVLTTSEAEDDVLRSYSLHANAYVTKPVDFERFIEVVRQIDDFFVTVVRLPTPTLGVVAVANGPALEALHPEEHGEQAERHEQGCENHGQITFRRSSCRGGSDETFPSDEYRSTAPRS